MAIHLCLIAVAAVAVAFFSCSSPALDTCNRMVPSGNVSCLNPEQPCHDSGPDSCDLAGSFDPMNCEMAANRGISNKWNCVGGGAPGTHCLNNGEETYCNQWFWCYHTNSDYHCTQSGYQCYMPQTLNSLASGGNPCMPPSH